MRGSRWVLTEGENLGRWFPDDSPPARVLASPGSSLPPGLREIELCRLRRGRVQRLGIAGQFLLPPEQRRHPLHLRRLLRIGGEVAHFERVSSQIKELRPIDLRIPDQLPVVLADGALHFREGGQDRLTRRPDIFRQPRGEAPALALLRRGQPGERAERRENIREIALRRVLPPHPRRPAPSARGSPAGFQTRGAPRYPARADGRAHPCRRERWPCPAERTAAPTPRRCAICPSGRWCNPPAQTFPATLSVP